MMPNNAINAGMDFNRFGPTPVAPTGQPFAGQNPNMVGLAMNGPSAVPFNTAGRQMQVGQNNNNRFNNNSNNRGNFQGGIQKRMRRY